MGIGRGKYFRLLKANSYLFAAGALALLLAFTGARTLMGSHDLYDARNVFTPCIHVPPNREHWGKPNCRGVSRLGEKSAEMRFNSIGLRDRDYEPKPAKGVFRILVLGSSNTLGPGVEEHRTFPRQLERALRIAGQKAEVINGAMIGYCTLQSSFRLRELLEKYSPHLVLYQFVQGACPLVDGAWHGRVRYEGGAPVGIDRNVFPLEGPLAGLNPFFFRHERLFFLALTVVDQWRKAAFSRTCSGPESCLAATVEFLGYMKASAGAKGADFLVVSYRMKQLMQSVPAQFHFWLVRPLSLLIRALPFTHEELFAYLRARGFRVAYPDFETPPLLVPGDSHLSEEGILLLAQAAAQEILSTARIAPRRTN